MMASQEPFGKSKQPTLKIPTGSQLYVEHEKQVDGGWKKRPSENVTQSGLLEGNLGLKLNQSKSFGFWNINFSKSDMFFSWVRYGTQWQDSPISGAD
ncbi:hypothetical protein O181_091285 [Austropuccinia psidii MF-1]|uniref:Uncharacterized protein n=1 Tax=Austropuccinia psidii MF-1 TaxID=1389203 RepID=A0A9Q3P7Z1_9BASI|nr:hypothetical protein [Austropuccinia psidii MF-1]